MKLTKTIILCMRKNSHGSFLSPGFTALLIFVRISRLPKKARRNDSYSVALHLVLHSSATLSVFSNTASTFAQGKDGHSPQLFPFPDCSQRFSP